MRTMPLWITAAAVSLLPSLAPADEAPAPAGRIEPAAGPLRVHPRNPRWFADPSGRAVLLAGSHTWPDLVDMSPSDPPERFDFEAFLDFLVRHDHDFLRLWTWELTTWNTRANGAEKVHHAWPQPWVRSGPGLALDGKPRFDLTRFDPDVLRPPPLAGRAPPASGASTSRSCSSRAGGCSSARTPGSTTPSTPATTSTASTAMPTATARASRSTSWLTPRSRASRKPTSAR